MGSTKYKEIIRLHEMLEEAGIEHEWYDRFERMIPERERKALRQRDFWKEMDWGWQVVIRKEDGDSLVSAVEGFGTYGEADDRIEIMGLTRNGDQVEGWLTAEDVFERIREALA